MHLLDPAEMPRLGKIDVPYKFYTVMREPFLLAGMRYPWDRNIWKDLWHAGFTDVVCLLGSDHGYDPYPLEIFHAADLVDLYGGAHPSDPEREEELVREATRVTAKGLREGKGIIVHCVAGTGRTGTVLGCVLRELGFPADAVLGYLRRVNLARGRKAWPESPWQEEMIRKY